MITGTNLLNYIVQATYFEKNPLNYAYSFQSGCYLAECIHIEICKFYCALSLTCYLCLPLLKQIPAAQKISHPT